MIERSFEEIVNCICCGMKLNRISEAILAQNDKDQFCCSCWKKMNDEMTEAFDYIYERYTSGNPSYPANSLNKYHVPKDGKTITCAKCNRPPCQMCN